MQFKKPILNGERLPDEFINLRRTDTRLRKGIVLVRHSVIIQTCHYGLKPVT